MRYDEFRDRLQDCLREAGLFFQHADRPSETIDLVDSDRRWMVYIGRSAPQKADPFFVSAKIGFRWDPFAAARSYTCEEDLLTELLGRKEPSPKTKPRLLRVDLDLYATLPYGSTTPMPDPLVFGAWTTSISEKLDKLLPETEERRGNIAVMGYRGDVEVQARSIAGGSLALTGISLSGFRMVRVPRIWNDPDRRDAEKGAGQEMDRLARRFKGALVEWTTSVAELATWLRYFPPPPVTAPRSDIGFEHKDMGKDDEPSSTH
jgi:hypothetical protein